MTKPKATDYTSSLILADYYLDLGLGRISDQIRYKTINTSNFRTIYSLRVVKSRSQSKSVRMVISVCSAREKFSIVSWSSTKSKSIDRSYSRSRNGLGH